ncbi:hypothetical protein EHP00_26 [Ecytonucleospora hepatopenaei]|uniref:Uncharacterized protein n=1 Tax=Ecytonucleospora hepatopenaei TaxID=646526 RepID=A0A1W0E5Q9_9MICR|nr:hypothetical protein EHP00_26 [Ecytonucleospora hepatopenaei]
MPMWSEWEELNETYKLGKLFVDKIPTTKEAKDKLNELSLYINSYVVTILKKQNKEITKEAIDKIFKTLE